MEKVISDSERSQFFNIELRDYFKVIVTSNVLGDRSEERRVGKEC